MVAPRKKPEERMRNSIHILVTDAYFDRIYRRAAKERLSMTSFARSVIERYLDEHDKPTELRIDKK